MRRSLFGKNYYIALLYQLFVAIPKNAFKFLLKGKIANFLAYYKAIGWHMAHFISAEIHENPKL
jgi:hypothetical protein